MEERILLGIHQMSSSPLDSVFWLSHHLGTHAFCTALVVLMALYWTVRHDRREALLWVALGLSVLALQYSLKIGFERARPDLWAGPVAKPSSFAFPSGHALAAATFYPLLARTYARHFPSRAMVAYAAGVAIAVYVGFGRLYLGVHWPTDVAAGWTIGIAQTVVAMRIADRLARRPRPAAAAAPDESGDRR